MESIYLKSGKKHMLKYNVFMKSSEYKRGLVCMKKGARQ
jgi:hypothetical protein